MSNLLVKRRTRWKRGTSPVVEKNSCVWASQTKDKGKRKVRRGGWGAKEAGADKRHLEQGTARDHARSTGKEEERKLTGWRGRRALLV